MSNHGGLSRPHFVGIASALLAMVAGCAQPTVVVSPTNPTGPSPQPVVNAAVLSVPLDPTRPALVTQVDVFGETVTGQANVGPQNSPPFDVSSTALTIDPIGSPLYTANSDGTVSSARLGGNALQTRNVTTSSLPPGGQAASIFSTQTSVYVAEPARNSVAVLDTSTANAVRTEIPVGRNPVYIVGTRGGQRVYSINQGSDTLTAIETADNTISGTLALPAGADAVYGVENASARRAFIVNRGANSVTVVDTQQNRVQQTIAVGTAPVWADIDNTGSQLVVANSGSNSVTIINIALDVFGNNAPGFGDAVTVPVGAHPVALAVLQDGTRVYTANQGDGSIGVVDLRTKRLLRNIALLAANGHPTSIAAVAGSPRGLVLATAPDSQLLTMVRTDTDTVDASLQVNGAGAAVRLSSQ